MLKTITIHKAAQLMTDALVGIEVPSLAEFGHDPDDDRWFFQTMSHRNAIVDAIKAGDIRAVNEFSLMPTTYYIEMPDTQPIRWDDFLAFASDLGIPMDTCNEVKNTARPQGQQIHQEREILRVINELGYNPKCLPARKPGKPGAKALVRKSLKLSDGVFNKAWERLRSDGDIAGGE
jgi:hypothetical protein